MRTQRRQKMAAKAERLADEKSVEELKDAWEQAKKKAERARKDLYATKESYRDGKRRKGHVQATQSKARSRSRKVTLLEMALEFARGGA